MGNQSDLREHNTAVEWLRTQYSALPAGSPVRLSKPTSNLFRFREPSRSPGLDVSAFGKVLSVDAPGRTAQVGGMTTYENLVAATLPHGLMPTVVPQLKTITIGGAVAGLGIESSSFRDGLPHEAVREMEILTGDGRVVLARADNDDAELFHGFPNSYGTLGYTLRCEIELQPVRPYVQLRHVRCGDAEEAAELIAEVCLRRSHLGQQVDFVDGTAFTPRQIYVTLGTFTDNAPSGTSDYTGQQIYYRSIPLREVDHLSTHDYLWRWDTDWFWCSGALGAQNALVRRFWPARYLRSDVYRRIVAFDRRHRLMDRAYRLLGQRQREAVIQDIEVPVEKLAEFLDFFDREVGIRPVWLCPLRLRSKQAWPLYPLQPETLYVNVGFWSTAALPPGAEDGHFNRMIERKVTELGGHKSLYSTSYYSEQEFAELYNGAAYQRLKKEYDPDGRLPDLYTKCVRGN
ncbi:MAG: FAD-binding protein [Sciscionella sp.]